MIDLITSKLAMMVAAMIILTTVLGVYAVQREHGKDLELMNIAETICGAIDDMSAIQGDTVLNITFDLRDEGRYIEPLVNGKNFDIIITTHEVIISQDDRHYELDFMAPIHPWKPERNSFTISEIQESDAEHDELSFSSGNDFTIERMRSVVGEEGRFLTFVYL
jgi:hypothetical protein